MGSYLSEIAEECLAVHSEKITDQPLTFFTAYAQKKLLAEIRQTLFNYGISFDVWFSELSLHQSDAIEQAILTLQQAGHVYEAEGAWWLKSTLWGDDKDRVLKKASGEYTYAAADVAYLTHKASRGYTDIIYILGHDHHSYAQRLRSIQEALGLTEINLNVILYQLVTLKKGGVELRMSKRAGTMVTLQEVIDTVNKDVARFFYLQRRADSQLEFDLALATTHSQENPVYYIQYAYVRCNSILAKITGDSADDLSLGEKITEQDAQWLTTDEALLIRKIASLPSLLTEIAETLQPYLLTNYTFDLAQLFNAYYNAHRVIDPENRELSRGRLFMVHLVRNTLHTLLGLLGISRPERM